MQNEETNLVEYKESLNEDKDKYGLEIEVESFLNSLEGGTIYIGIKNSGKVVGVINLDETQLKIKDRIKNNISPSTIGLFNIEVEEIEGKKVIKISILSGKEKPYYVRRKGMNPDGCHIRIGSSRESMTEKMIENLISKRFKPSLKEIKAPRQNLTFKQLKIYYEEQHINLGENFLQNLDLLTSEGELNYIAFLLADENNVPIPVVKYAGTTKKEIVENEDYGNRCLITVAYRILDKLDTENRTFTKIEYYGRKHEAMFDTNSMKEAVINAICHNDYSYGGSPIVEIYSDRIEITSAGGLPTELSKQDFLNGVVYRRNRELIKVFQDLDLMENVGSGILRILENYNKDCFIFLDNYLRVSFKFKENPFEYESKNKVSVDDTINDTLNDTIKLTKNEKQILNLIISNNKITREEIVKETNLSDRTISRAIKHLQDENLIFREGSKKTGFWKIK